MSPPPTIACLLTPPGKGGIAVISLRGPRAGEIVAKLFRPLRTHAEGGGGRLQLGRLVASGQVLDEAVVQSQGDWAEINIHGGPAVARGVLEAMLHCGATIAIPPSSANDSTNNEVARPTYGLPTAHPRWNNPAIGEEMLQALPHAASATVVSAISRQWSAGISELVRTALEELEFCPKSRPIAMGRLCEQQDVGRATCCTRNGRASRLRQAADGLAVMRRILEPAEVVLAGPPNAGKSTLANALVGRPISIVHETPGTTRDWVRELALLGGVPVWITDTAGLVIDEGVLRGMGVPSMSTTGVSPADVPSSIASSSPSPSQNVSPLSSPAPQSDLQLEIDRQSSRRALERISRADLVLVLGQPPASGAVARGGRAKVIPVWTKADACPPPSGGIGDYPGLLSVSAKTGEGMEQLTQAILRALDLEDIDPAAARAFTARQAELLRAAADSLDGEDARQASSSLHRLLGG